MFEDILGSPEKKDKDCEESFTEESEDLYSEYCPACGFDQTDVGSFLYKGIQMFCTQCGCTWSL